MKNLLNISIFSMFALTICNSCLTDNDTDFLLSFAQPLGISYYILVDKSCTLQITFISSLVKKISKANVYLVYLDFSNFLDLFLSETFPNFRTAVVFKIGDEKEKNDIAQGLKKLSFENKFSSFKWIMLLRRNSSGLSETNFYVPYDCQYITATESLNGYDISEIFQVKEKSKMIHTNVGHWNRRSGLRFSGDYIYSRRMNMGKENLILGKYTTKRCKSSNECLNLEMWLVMERALNFSTTVINKNEITKKEKSLIPDVYIYVAPYHVINTISFYMIAPTIIVKSHLYIKFITDENQSWALYFKPFNQALWTAITGWVLISSILIVVTAKTASVVLSLKGFTLLDQSLTPLSAFSNQACIQHPRIMSSRIARITAFVASSVILPAYSAALISCLTIHRPIIPFTDFETFVQDGTYKMASMYHPFIVALFSYADDPTIKAIKEKQLIPFDNFPKSHATTAAMLCNDEKLAVMTFNYRLLLTPTPCPIVRVSNTVLNVYVGLQLKAGSPYRTIFNKLLTKIRETGDLYKLQQGIYGPKEIKAVKGFQPIHFKMTTSVHNFSIAATISSIIFLIAEIIWFHASRSYALKKTRLQNDRRV